MTIANRLEEIRTAKANIKNAIQDELGEDLSNVAFVDYYQYIKSSGGYYAPSLNISYAEQEEYVVGTEVTFNGVTKTLDGSTVLANVPITYNGAVVATSGADGTWSYTTTWVSGGCEFTVVDEIYGIICKELVYPQERFYDSFTNLQTKLDALSKGETLILDCNYRYLDSTADGNGVTIYTRDITIDGQGKYTLDGNSLSWIIQTINSIPSGVSLKGVIFKNGNTSGRGGAISNYGNDMSISDCTFTNNTASTNGGAISNFSSNSNVDDCYWGTNTPIFNNALIDGLTVNTYLLLEITTETEYSQQYIKVQAKQYNPSTSTTSTHRTPLNGKVTITVGGATYTKVFRNGIVRQAYTAPTAPYDITVKLADGEVLTKTITE